MNEMYLRFVNKFERGESSMMLYNGNNLYEDYCIISVLYFFHYSAN